MKNKLNETNRAPVIPMQMIVTMNTNQILQLKGELIRRQRILLKSEKMVLQTDSQISDTTMTALPVTENATNGNPYASIALWNRPLNAPTKPDDLRGGAPPFPTGFARNIRTGLHASE